MNNNFFSREIFYLLFFYDLPSANDVQALSGLTDALALQVEDFVIHYSVLH
jgi:hypothetical protein